MDRYTAEPLVYKLTKNGYILYSLGPNMKDDGGVAPSAAQNGNWDIVVTAP